MPSALPYNTEAADMTDTLPPKNGSKPSGKESAVGLQKHKRTATDIGLALITPIVGQEFLDRYNLRDPLNRTLKYGVKQVFSAAGASTRQFKRIQGLGKAPTRLKASGADYFDLTPDEDQKLILETVREFADEILRPAARDADNAASYPPDLIAKAAELGITAINIPEDFDGIASHRCTVTNALVAEALAYGDMGLALPILAPGGVASALTHWGSADQQATYLPEFAGENVPQACVAIAEPHALFDPTALKTTAVRTPSGYRLNGVKSLVPAAADAELFIVGAQLSGKPALFIVESSSKGLTVKADPSMGIRAAALGRLELDNVSVPLASAAGRGRRHRRRLLQGDRLVAPGLGGTGGRHLARRARPRGPLHQGAPGIRRTDRPPPGGGVHVRQHRDRARRASADHLARRRPRRARVCRSPARPHWPSGSAPTRACRSVWTASSCWAATATPRNIPSNAGTATCGPSASPRAS